MNTFFEKLSPTGGKLGSCARRCVLLVLVFMLLGSTSSCKQDPWALWGAYAARFINGQGRVIDPQGGDRTTSEGQSYALFFALVANDRPRFDGLLRWTQTSLAGGDLGARLPGWLWGRSPSGEWKLLDANSAADGDIWIAYSLLEAGRLWRDANYTKLGRRMLAEIAQQETANLPGFGTMLLPGPATSFVHGQTWTLNPSYLPPFVFERFAAVDGAGPWDRIAQNIPRLLEMSARRGFVMDWVDYVPSDGFYPSTSSGPQATKDSPPAMGSYDAIRVYLWTGMVGDEGMQARMCKAESGLATYLADHKAPPEKVDAEGIPGDQDGPVGFSAAVLPYVKTFPNLERVALLQKIRLSNQLDRATNLYGKAPGYYDQNLALFGTGFVDGKFKFGPRGELKVDWTRP